MKKLLLAMTRRTLAISFVLGMAARADAQGFAPGQSPRFEGSTRFAPGDVSEPDDPESDRDRAVEARDRYADARRLAERHRKEMERQLTDMNDAVDAMPENLAKTQAGAVDSARKLPERIGKSRSRNPTTQFKAGSGALKDLEKTKDAYEDFGYGAEMGLGPDRSRLRSQISKLTKDIDFYRRQEAYWQSKANAAQAEIDANAEWTASLERSRRQGVWKAWAQDQMHAARATDNANARSQHTSGQGSSQNSTTRDHEPSRSSGERASEGKDRDRIRGEVGMPRDHEVRTREGVQEHTWK